MSGASSVTFGDPGVWISGRTPPALRCPPPLWHSARAKMLAFADKNKKPFLFSSHHSSVSDLSQSVEKFFFCCFCFISLLHNSSVSLLPPLDYFCPFCSAVIHPVPRLVVAYKINGRRSKASLVPCRKASTASTSKNKQGAVYSPGNGS